MDVILEGVLGVRVVVIDGLGNSESWRRDDRLLQDWLSVVGDSWLSISDSGLSDDAGFSDSDESAEHDEL